ncbi:hypothetical protein J8F10_13080 [Gemmata sp. G18]|uniref:DUF4926 domain-containing protein n=1 Tax=Gemmata palustris TaxID=2822762 RepID=A0ABS5BS26_9BACT|nr:hypothetical protein [Gemmata palustris]MBP3956217.1 hypothetical protein [Gemmata palustris]
MKTLEAWYGVPPGREGPVVQLFFADGGPQWGEVSTTDGRLVLEVFPQDSAALSLPVGELLEVLRLARDRLSDDPN